VTGPPADYREPEAWGVGARSYDAAMAPLTAPFAASMLDDLGVFPGAAAVRLLDVAAGTGALALEAARRGASVLATDFAPGMVAVLRHHLEEAGLAAEVQTMDGQALSVEDGSFDVAASNFGLIFFPDRAKGLAELRRALRAGGRAGIACWDLAGWSLPRLLGAALDRVLPDRGPPTPPVWAALGTADGMHAALSESGFSRVAVRRVTHHWPLEDPAAFFRAAPDGSPTLRALFADLSDATVKRAAAAFASAGTPRACRCRPSSGSAPGPDPLGR
jgi:SAM-dependent methyltransferase